MLADLRALLLPDTIRAALGLTAPSAEEAEARPEPVESACVRTPALACAADVRTPAGGEPLPAQRPVERQRSGG